MNKRLSWNEFETRIRKISARNILFLQECRLRTRELIETISLKLLKDWLSVDVN
jgi:hypothetical protein